MRSSCLLQGHYYLFYSLLHFEASTSSMWSRSSKSRQSLFTSNLKMKAFNLSSIKYVSYKVCYEDAFQLVYRKTSFISSFLSGLFKKQTKKKRSWICQMFSAFSVIILMAFPFSYIYDNYIELILECKQTIFL